MALTPGCSGKLVSWKRRWLQEGLMGAMLDRDEDGNLVRKAGVMSVVVAGAIVQAGDPIRVVLPSTPHEPLHPV